MHPGERRGGRRLAPQTRRLMSAYLGSPQDTSAQRGGVSGANPVLHYPLGGSRMEGAHWRCMSSSPNRGEAA